MWMRGLRAEMDVSKMKVAELKKELQKRGLDTSGLKAALASRLHELGRAFKLDMREFVT